MPILPGQGRLAHVESGEPRNDPPRRRGGPASARRLRLQAQFYLAQVLVGLGLAAVNLSRDPLNRVDLLLAAAGLAIAVVAFVLWRKRRREARLAGE